MSSMLELLTNYNPVINATGCYACSFSLFLHGLKFDRPFYRKIKDIDIYLFGSSEVFPNLFPYQEKILTEYGLFSTGLLESQVGVVHVDICAKNYLFDTIAPIMEDTFLINVLGEEFRITTIEHTLTLKLLSAFDFRNKHVDDIHFILKSFDVDLEACKEFQSRSKFKDYEVEWHLLHNKGPIGIADDLREQILVRYKVLNELIPLNKISYNYLAPLVNVGPSDFGELEAAEKLVYLFTVWLINEAKCEKAKIATCQLAALYFATGLQAGDVSIRLALLQCIYLNSGKVVSDAGEATFHFSVRCRYLSKLLKYPDSPRLIVYLAKQRRFHKFYFKVFDDVVRKSMNNPV